MEPLEVGYSELLLSEEEVNEIGLQRDRSHSHIVALSFRKSLKLEGKRTRKPLRVVAEGPGRKARATATGKNLSKELPFISCPTLVPHFSEPHHTLTCSASKNSEN